MSSASTEEIDRRCSKLSCKAIQLILIPHEGGKMNVRMLVPVLFLFAQVISACGPAPTPAPRVVDRLEIPTGTALVHKVAIPYPQATKNPPPTYAPVLPTSTPRATPRPELSQYVNFTYSETIVFRVKKDNSTISMWFYEYWVYPDTYLGIVDVELNGSLWDIEGIKCFSLKSCYTRSFYVSHKGYRHFFKLERVDDETMHLYYEPTLVEVLSE